MIGSRNLTRLLTIALGALLCSATPARADITAFLGLSPTPSVRVARGGAVGVTMIAVGFEFEFSNTAEDSAGIGPGLSTKMFNGLIITPTGGTQVYVSAGGGWFNEALAGHKESGIATNVGGGLKIKLAGPLRVRIDFRVFHLNDEAVERNPKRLYAGLSLGF